MSKQNRKYQVIGLMSGTSLDGIDIACCTFGRHGNKWNFEMEYAETLAYPTKLYERLKNCINFTTEQLDQLDLDLGVFWGNKTKKFIERNKLSPILIASHGHTVFHQPERGITLQIGSGEEIKRLTNVMIINDFRSEDVRLGGQGAPLVPIGDALLFSEYDYCLNLGGIANVSFHDVATNSRKAFDVCGCNLVLNYLADRLGKSYDKGGLDARSGKVVPDLMNALFDNPFYKKSYPKSLGKEDVWSYDIRIIDSRKEAVPDLLRTYVEHISIQLSQVISTGSLLITGGGAFNDFLIERIRTHCDKSKLVLPDSNTISFKEAMVFAFLGLLRYLGETNVLSSVTGASRDSCSGQVYT